MLTLCVPCPPNSQRCPVHPREQPFQCVGTSCSPAPRPPSLDPPTSPAGSGGWPAGQSELRRRVPSSWGHTPDFLTSALPSLGSARTGSPLLWDAPCLAAVSPKVCLDHCCVCLPLLSASSSSCLDMYEAHGAHQPKIQRNIQEIKRQEPKHNTAESHQHTRKESKGIRKKQGKPTKQKTMNKMAGSNHIPIITYHNICLFKHRWMECSNRKTPGGWMDREARPVHGVLPPHSMYWPFYY